jgi:hypothetical protein
MPNVDLALSYPNTVIVPGEEWTLSGTIQTEGTANAFDYTGYNVRCDVSIGSYALATTGNVTGTAASGTFVLTLTATMTDYYPSNSWGTLVIHLHNTSTPSLNKHVSTIGFRTSAETI